MHVACVYAYSHRYLDTDGQVNNSPSICILLV